MQDGASCRRASLRIERAGQLTKKCEGDSSSVLHSLHDASPGEIFPLLRYLNLDASSSSPSQPTRSLILKFEGPCIERSS